MTVDENLGVEKGMKSIRNAKYVTKFERLHFFLVLISLKYNSLFKNQLK